MNSEFKTLIPALVVRIRDYQPDKIEEKERTKTKIQIIKEPHAILNKYKMSILHQSTHLAQQQLKCPKYLDTWNTRKIPKFYSTWAGNT